MMECHLVRVFARSCRACVHKSILLVQNTPAISVGQCDSADWVSASCARVTGSLGASTGKRSKAASLETGRNRYSC